jgi:hypothetical protein
MKNYQAFFFGNDQCDLGLAPWNLLSWPVAYGMNTHGALTKRSGTHY